MPHKVWAVGEEALAADMNSLLQQQVVAQFANAAQRDSQYVAPPIGALCTLTDTLTQWIWTGSAWQQCTPTRTVAVLLASANGSATSAITVIPGTTQTLTIGPGARKLRFDMWGFFSPDAAGQLIRIGVRMDTNPLAFIQAYHGASGGSGQQYLGASSYYATPVAAGSHTFDMYVQRVIGGTTATAGAGTHCGIVDIGI